MSVNTLVKCLHYLVVSLVQIIIILRLILSVDQLTDTTASLLFFFLHIKDILKECQSVFFLYTPIIFCCNNRVVVKEKKTIYCNNLGHSMRLFVVDLFKNKPILYTLIFCSYSIMPSKLCSHYFNK
jgi:hypothetical protein